jgi:hypothetical protein
MELQLCKILQDIVKFQIFIFSYVRLIYSSMARQLYLNTLKINNYFLL